MEKANRETGEKNAKRAPKARWGRQLEFVLSCVGYAVGLSNIWRFPYLCIRNGGGAFLVPYLLFLLAFGVPFLYLELAVAQYGSASCVTMWKLCPLFKGIGWCTILLNVILVTYQNTLLTWIFYYLYSSFHSTLPWTTCDNAWNTDACLSRLAGANITNSTDLLPRNVSGISPYAVVEENGTAMKVVSPPEEFWHYRVQELSSGIEHPDGLRWPLVLCHLIGWTIIALTLIKGIRSAGKVVYLTVILPYVLLTILLVRGCTLPGSLEGIIFYIRPEWKKLLKPKIWAEAALQVFFSLGPGWGGLINLASHNKFHNNIERDAFLISFINSGTSLYGGFAVFAVIGFMAQKANLPVDKVITSGPGLAFIVYPEALGSLPLPQLWSVLFFLMLLTLVMDSQFASVECILGSLRDECSNVLNTRRRQWLMTAAVYLIVTLVGLIFCTRGGLYIFQVWDWYIAVFIGIVTSMEALVVCWIYGLNRFFQDIASMIGKTPNVIFKGLWGAICPLLMVSLFIYTSVIFTAPTYGDYVYPAWTNAFGWCLSGATLIPIPVFIVYKLVRSEGTLKQRLWKTTRPSSDWGPQNTEKAISPSLGVELLKVEKMAP